RVQVTGPLAAVLQLLGEPLAARQAGGLPNALALREVLVLEHAFAARPRREPLGELALDRDAAAVGAVQRHVDGWGIAGQARGQRGLELEARAGGSADAERFEERRVIAGAPV